MPILLESNRRQQFQLGKRYTFSKKLFSDMFESVIKNLFSLLLPFPGKRIRYSRGLRHGAGCLK